MVVAQLFVAVGGWVCTMAREISTGVLSWLFRLIGFYSVTETSKLRPVIRDISRGYSVDVVPVSLAKYDYPIAFRNSPVHVD